MGWVNRRRDHGNSSSSISRRSASPDCSRQRAYADGHAKASRSAEYVVAAVGQGPPARPPTQSIPNATVKSRSRPPTAHPQRHAPGALFTREEAIQNEEVASNIATLTWRVEDAAQLQAAPRHTLAIRESLSKQGFLESRNPHPHKFQARGHAIFLFPAACIPGEFYAFAQSRRSSSRSH